MSKRVLSLHKVCEKIIKGEADLFSWIDLSEYDVIIAGFMQAKENYIDKERHGETSYTLHFDYNYSQKVLWDIYFLGRYIYENSDARTRTEIERKADNAVGQNYDFSGINYDFLNLPSSFSADDLKKLKQAIIAVEKIRDAFAHSNVGINNECFQLRNNYNSSYLMCDLPIKYLRFFGSGIIPDLKDKKISSFCNHAIEKHGTAILNELSSYTIPPANLKRINDLIEKKVQEKISNSDIPSNLLHLFNAGKIAELKKKMCAEMFNRIPLLLFRTSKKRLERLLEITQGDIEKLIALPRVMYYENSQRHEALLEKYPLDVLINYPEPALLCNKQTLERILEILENDINRLKKISPRVFQISIEKINFLFELVDNNVESFVNLPEKLYAGSLNRIKYLFNDLGLNIDEIAKLNSRFLHCPKQKLIRCLELVDNDPRRLNEVSLFAVTNDFSEEDLERFSKLSKNELSIINEIMMCKKTGIKVDSLLFIIKCGLEKGWDQEKIIQLSSKAAMSDISFIQHIFEYACYDIDILLKIPKGCFLFNGNKLDFLLSQVDNKLERLNEYELLASDKRQSEIIFSPKCNIPKLRFILSYIDNDTRRLNEIPNFVFSDECSIDRLKFLLEYTKNDSGEVDITKLKGITLSAFTCNEERLAALYELGNRKLESLYGLPTFLFGDTISLDKIKFLLEYTKDDSGQYDLSKLRRIPWLVYKCKEDRIKLVMKLVGNNITLLSSLPKELFLCTHDSVVYEVYYQYSENMIKSIFGVSEEKTIALMLYMNSVFRVKGSSNATYKSFKLSEMDLSSINISSMNGNLKNSITAMLNRLCPPEKMSKVEDAQNLLLSNVASSSNEFNKIFMLQNREICRFLRNCSEHFRIWPLEGNKVKLVDGGMVCIVDVSVVYNLVESFFNGDKDFTTEELPEEIISRATLLQGNFNSDLSSSKWNTEYSKLMGTMTENDKDDIKQKLQKRENKLLGKIDEIVLHNEKSRRNNFVKGFVLSRSEFNELKKSVGFSNVLNDLYIKLHHMKSIGLEDIKIFNDSGVYKVKYKFNDEYSVVELDNLWDFIITHFGTPENLEPILQL